MNNKLEDFIHQHRQAFDTKSPDPMVWMDIESRLDKMGKHKVFPLMFLKIAAVFAVILCCGIIIGLNMQYSHRTQLDYTASPELRQLKDAETYYKLQVNQKYNELNDTVTKANVAEDLKQLEAIYEQLKSEMISSEYTNSEVLINAMIKNHKTKIDILESILNKQKNSKNENEHM